jgi:hypothetical protein
MGRINENKNNLRFAEINYLYSFFRYHIMYQISVLNNTLMIMILVNFFGQELIILAIL